ncbi:MAG: hypothetical protein MW690_001450 [Methanophagales archaeon]|nr:hypothetical protein [Methanophagales archaeon]
MPIYLLHVSNIYRWFIIKYAGSDICPISVRICICDVNVSGVCVCVILICYTDINPPGGVPLLTTALMYVFDALVSESKS